MVSDKFYVGVFLGIAVFLGVDLYGDLSSGLSAWHAVAEGGALTIAVVVALSYLINLSKETRKEHNKLSSEIDSIIAERNSWREHAGKFLAGLGLAIDKQFEQWCLSPSEKEIGLLLLKGLSHKEIANLRKTSERTVRQQAAAIYSKARLENKAQLLAFFLEDLMIPPTRKVSEPQVEQADGPELAA